MNTKRADWQEGCFHPLQHRQPQGGSHRHRKDCSAVYTRKCAPSTVSTSAGTGAVRRFIPRMVMATRLQTLRSAGNTTLRYGQHKNVITSMQMGREIAPTRPSLTILRPGDQKVPDKIALRALPAPRRLGGQPHLLADMRMYSVSRHSC